MRLPYSWLREAVQAGAPGWDVSPEELEAAFIRIGHEVEDVIFAGPVTGPLTVGRVVEIEELTEFKKPIRACKVDVGEAEPRDIVCGARNFAVGDLIVAALPGCVLPGEFKIATRKTYGRTSDGMICSAAELGLGADHSGIMVFPPGTAEPGDSGIEVLGLDDVVFDLAITPDRGYGLSIRGVAREIACAYDLDFVDPAAVAQLPAEGDAWPLTVDPATGVSRFALRPVTGIDASRPMLDDFRERLAKEPAEVQKRITLREGDMRTTKLRKKFPLVLCTFNTILHLYTHEDLAAFFARVQAHLAPGGRFVVDLSTPSLADLAHDPDPTREVRHQRRPRGRFLDPNPEREQRRNLHPHGLEPQAAPRRRLQAVDGPARGHDQRGRLQPVPFHPDRAQVEGQCQQGHHGQPARHGLEPQARAVGARHWPRARTSVRLAAGGVSPASRSRNAAASSTSAGSRTTALKLPTPSAMSRPWSLTCFRVSWAVRWPSCGPCQTNRAKTLTRC